jgi:hypothetical protein
MRATGWLGWSERQALEADVNSILLALEGRAEFIEETLVAAGFVKRKKRPVPKGNISARFKAFAKEHNALWRQGRIKRV